MADNLMVGYAGYVGLKLRRAADIYADILCRALNAPYDSREAYFLRRLVRAWLGYDDPRAGMEDVLNPLSSGNLGSLTAKQLRLLQAFDIPFRIRRVRALVHMVNGEYSSTDDRRPLDDCKKILSDIVLGYEQALDDRETDLGWIEAVRSFYMDESTADLLKTFMSNPAGAAEKYDDALTHVFETISGRFADMGATENSRLGRAIMALPESIRVKAARELIAFPVHDVSIFPLMDAAGLVDPISVDTLRISPYDAKIVGDRKKKLASADMGAFKGFLDRKLREIDLLYGRLNGAERMIQIIVQTGAANPNSRAMQALRRRHTLDAMQIILDEAASSKYAEVQDEIENLRLKLNAARAASPETG
ncbi:MAG: DUF3376 domain-containing protein [Alphaproteobacteria bacterium]